MPPDKVLYEEIMMNDDNLESNLLTSSLFKICSLYKLSRRFQEVKQWQIQDFLLGGGAEPLGGVPTSDVGAFWQKHVRK